MGNSMELVLKECKDCGIEEMMVPSCERCSACREKRMAYNNAKYRERHREELRRKSISRYYEKKRAAHERSELADIADKKIFPVQYLEEGGKYIWRVRQFNPITNRFFIWESEREFETLLDAQKDYTSATR